jgi:lipoprotein signal peptidase
MSLFAFFRFRYQLLIRETKCYHLLVIKGLFAFLSIFLFLFDFMIKEIVKNSNNYYRSQVSLWIWKLKYLKNPGVIFGVFGNYPSLVIILTLSLLLVALGNYLLSLRFYSTLGWGFIFIGGLGNFLDRVINDFVSDYLVWNGSWLSWIPGSFNLSDVYIFCGIFIILGTYSLEPLFIYIMGKNKKNNF